MIERIYHPGQDEDSILDLRARVWGSDHPHSSRAFYKWLFVDTPDGMGSGNIVERNGKPVGFAGLANRSAQIGKTRVRVAHGLDFMADPGLGGMLSGRVVLKIVNAHAKLAVKLGYDCSLNYPNDSSHKILISKKMKYQPVLNPDLYVCTVSAFTIKGRGIAKQIAPRIAGTLGGLYATIRSVGAGKTAEIQMVTKFDGRFDDHWGRLIGDNKLRFIRDARTLRWRYSENPLYQYSTLVALEAGAIVGFVVVSQRHLFGTDALLICDLCAVDGNRHTETALLDAVQSTAKSRDVSVIVAQALRASTTSLSLGRMGFVRTPQRVNPKLFRMVATKYTDLGAKVLEPDRWAFSWGDMDVV